MCTCSSPHLARVVLVEAGEIAIVALVRAPGRGSSSNPVWPSVSRMMSLGLRARLSAEVKAMSNAMPRALSFSAPALASSRPSSVRSTSRQPVKRFFRFHSLWPWRTTHECAGHGSSYGSDLNELAIAN